MKLPHLQARSRWPGVGGAMLLVGVIAVGLGIGTQLLKIRHSNGYADAGWDTFNVLAGWVLLAVAAGLAIPLIARKNRSGRQIGRHAGTAVVLATLVRVGKGMGAETCWYLGGSRRWYTFVGWIGETLTTVVDAYAVAPAVAATWLSIVVIDRPRWAYDWFDRVGGWSDSAGSFCTPSS